jgi:hypothetical protein
MENPFVFSDMVFDADYTPEGAGVQVAYTFNDKHGQVECRWLRGR